MAFRPARVNRLLGTDLDADEQRALLGRVGIETRAAAAGTRIRVAAGTRPLDVDAGDDEVVEATVPTWRRDLAVEADIAEEIARVRGYELVPATPAGHADAGLPPRSARGARRRPRDARRAPASARP